MTADRPAHGTRRHHALWIGPLLTFAAAVSYFTYFTGFPLLRDTPWINLPLVLIGVGISGLGAWRAFGTTSRVLTRVLATAALAVSLAVGSLFTWYVTVFSYSLPASTASTVDLAALPALGLVDQHDRPIELAGFRGRRVVLVFYRGHW